MQTDKIMTILEIASDGHLAGAIALRRPFTPVERVRCPWRHVVAGPGRCVLHGKVHTAGQAVGQSRVGAWSNISQTKRGVRHVPLGAWRIVASVGWGHELRRTGDGSPWCCWGVG